MQVVGKGERMLSTGEEKNPEGKKTDLGRRRKKRAYSLVRGCQERNHDNHRADGSQEC